MDPTGETSFTATLAPVSVPRRIAFYLPQFHPIPENDAWWGRGFTEWTNVTKARPQFPGHYQPHLPSELGFYDLRLPEARQAQAALAAEHGIDGFCYYHYWFNGQRLLERPFDEVLASRQPAFPFCLCWANENWTRRWDGQDAEVLMRQSYDMEDHRRHIRWLASAFNDPRYIRVRGAALFLVYRIAQIPEALKMTEAWREEARRLGVGELFLCSVSSHSETDPRPIGFDAAVEFHPGARPLGFDMQRAGHRVFSYPAVVRKMLRDPKPPYERFRCVVPSWDNSARRERGATILQGATPDLYQYWLEQTLLSEMRPEPGAADTLAAKDRVVFINAWNEWAEGNHLEPCRRLGRGYLEATRRAIDNIHAARPMSEPAQLASVEGDVSLLSLRENVVAAIAEISEQSRRERDAATAELNRLSEELAWLDRIQDTLTVLKAHLPPRRAFIFVDDQQLALGDFFVGRQAVPFMENQGEYWGAPPDDEAAVRELDRQLSVGIRYVAVAWPCFWYLGHYAQWSRRLRSMSRRVIEGENVVLFELESP